MAHARARRMSPADRRRALLDTAIEMAGQEGLEALRMDALATRAGVTRPVVYEHFGDREGLVVALMLDIAEQVSARVLPAEAASEPDLAATLAAGTSAYFDAVATIGPAIRAAGVGVGLSAKVDATRRAIVTRPVTRWARRFVEQAGVPSDLAVTLAAAQLAALTVTADQWMAGRLERAPAEHLHVVASLAAVQALGDGRPGVNTYTS